MAYGLQYYLVTAANNAAHPLDIDVEPPKHGVLAGALQTLSY